MAPRYSDGYSSVLTASRPAIARFYCTFDDATLVAEMGKPFDVFAEGLPSEKSRGDKTLLELFLAGVHSLPADLISAARALATIDPHSQDT
jgi:hypothetical protein